MKVNGYKIKPGANLSGANLENANLTKANLTGANVDNKTLERAERARAKMYGDVPSLRHRSANYINYEDAYGSGKRAGSQFSTGRNGVNGQFQIGSGRRDN